LVDNVAFIHGLVRLIRFLPKARPSGRAFAQARFAFWIRGGMSSALFRSTIRIESYDAVIETHNYALGRVERAGHLAVL